VCSAAGCKYFDVDSKHFASGLQSDEVLVLTRTTNTVRAVEMQSGVEKYVHIMLTSSFCPVGPVFLQQINLWLI